jgi:predicted RNA-binding Zn-ribbon protein involved in translation (DUF1610 family)
VTTIRARCPECGDVQLGVDDLTVHVPDGERLGTYRFRCPHCDQTVTREATARIVQLLTDAGVNAEHWQWPAEQHEPRRGPALTPDDLLDFHVLLQREDWFDALLATDERRRP